MSKALPRAFIALWAGLFVLGTAAPVNKAYAGKERKEKRAFLGVYTEDLDQKDREALDFNGEYGVLVEDIVEDGPADEAGIEAGDIIVEIDGKRIESSENLIDRLRDYEPGDKVKVIVVRDGGKKSFKVKLGARSEEIEIHTMSRGLHIPCIKKKVIIKHRDRGFLGVEIETLEDQLAEYFDVEEGVLVEKVVEDSPAQDAGLKAGDVIVVADGESIASEEDLHDVLADHKPGDQVEFKVVRKGRELTLTATLAEPPEGVEILTDEDFDLGDLGDIIREALENIEIESEDDPESIHQEIEQLREEMQQFKKELRREMQELRERR